MNTLKLIFRACVTFPLLFAATAIFARDPIEVERTVVTLVAVDAEAVEGSDNPGVFLLQRRGNLHVPITVYLSISGTAENGVDYARLPEQVTIPAGEEVVRIPVEAIADDQTESVETVCSASRSPFASRFGRLRRAVTWSAVLPRPWFTFMTAPPLCRRGSRS